MGEREILAELDGTPLVAPDRRFAVAEHVRDVATKMNLHIGAWLCCPLCRQGIVQMSWDGALYQVTPEQRTALVVGHMIQTHGWTRESIGDC